MLAENHSILSVQNSGGKSRRIQKLGLFCIKVNHFSNKSLDLEDGSNGSNDSSSNDEDESNNKYDNNNIDLRNKTTWSVSLFDAVPHPPRTRTMRITTSSNAHLSAIVFKSFKTDPTISKDSSLHFWKNAIDQGWNHLQGTLQTQCRFSSTWNRRCVF